MMSGLTRRTFLETAGLGAAASFAVARRSLGAQNATNLKPNIVYILADDLGFNELGCYGQTKIRTPNVDRLAAEGVRFTDHYSASAVCAPTRCMLLTGKHSGHAYIRANDEMGDRGDVWNDPELEGQRPLLEGTFTIGHMMQRAGYATACIGKWGLGWYGSSGAPDKQGFDHFFGYICQREAHNYYPTHLWKNGEKVPLNNRGFRAHQRLPEDADPDDPASYEPYKDNDYAPDFMIEDALEFVRNAADRPFFLYFATPVPHVSLQVPEDSLAEYEGAFPETPYTGDRGYVPHRTPRAAYAAMITRMDRDIGRLIDELKALGVYENTLIMFSSDNGPTHAGGVDHEFFESAKPFSGLKGSLSEGGIRVPMVTAWPNKTAPGRVTGHISAQWDLMATLADIAGAKAAADTDGISFLPTLTGEGVQRPHESLYWEYKNQQAVRKGTWKAFRPDARGRPGEPVQLFDLENDPAEEHDLAGQHPDIVRELVEIMNSRTPSEFDKWNFPPAPMPEGADTA